MDLALTIGVVILVSLGYALHAILLLRWCGLWSRNRRLVLWVTQMLFPAIVGPAALFLGSEISTAYFGNQLWLGWRTAPVDALIWASLLLPALLLATGAFLFGPACVLWRRWAVWGSGFAGAAAGWGGALGAGLLTFDDGFGVLGALVGWHAGALGAPLVFAWRVRRKRIRSLGGRACLDCGYDLAGVTLDRCPECGARRPGPAAGAAGAPTPGGSAPAR